MKVSLTLLSLALAGAVFAAMPAGANQAAAQQDEVKEGSFVILLGEVDDKGVLHATRIDLRLPR